MIRARHTAQISALRKQIGDLEATMLGECETVLTDAQKQMLSTRRKAAIEGRAATELSKETKPPAKAGAR